MASSSSSYDTGTDKLNDYINLNRVISETSSLIDTTEKKYRMLRKQRERKLHDAVVVYNTFKLLNDVQKSQWLKQKQLKSLLDSFFQQNDEKKSEMYEYLIYAEYMSPPRRDPEDDEEFLSPTNSSSSSNSRHSRVYVDYTKEGSSKDEIASVPCSSTNSTPEKLSAKFSQCTIEESSHDASHFLSDGKSDELKKHDDCDKSNINQK